jgi:hypothetical protein
MRRTAWLAIHRTNAVSSAIRESRPDATRAQPATPAIWISVGAKLFAGPYFPTSPIRGYDVTPDGQRFLMVQMDRRRPLTAVREIVLVLNWMRLG